MQKNDIPVSSEGTVVAFGRCQDQETSQAVETAADSGTAVWDEANR